MPAAQQDNRLREWLESPPPRVASNLKAPAAVVSKLLPRRVRLPLRTTVTRAISPWAKRNLVRRVDASRSASKPVLLHVGCGPERKEGFINIDLLGAQVDVPLDLAQGIPLPDGSVDGIFHEHVFEHLPVRVGYGFMLECRRVLRPEGVLRVAVPDAGLCLDSYAGKADPGWANSKPVPMMAVEDLFYEHKHVAMYDEQKLTAIMRVAGFRGVERKQYGDTALSVVPDTPRRRDGTLYVEGHP